MTGREIASETTDFDILGDDSDRLGAAPQSVYRLPKPAHIFSWPRTERMSDPTSFPMCRILDRMSTTKTAGAALVNALGRQLPAHMEWTENELATLDLIEHATDRLVVLRRRFDARVSDPECSDSQLASLQTAIHQLEGDVFRWTKSLNLRVSEAKSIRQQHAANVRWHGSASA